LNFEHQFYFSQLLFKPVTPTLIKRYTNIPPESLQKGKREFQFRETAK